MRAVSLGVLVLAGVVAMRFAHGASITGEVRAIEAQPIYTPPSNASPVVLRYYVPDGVEVKKGEPILRIDPGQAGARLMTLAADLERAEARGRRDVADLEVKAIDAELAWIDAEAAVAKARFDAALPRELLSGIDFDRYKGELQRTERELVLKRDELQAAREAAARRRADAHLEAQRIRLEQEYQETQLKNAEVRAERDGVVLHGFDPSSGQRFDEGSSAQMGQLIGEVATVMRLGVRAYALESERDSFKRGDIVSIDFDALPSLHLTGRIEDISGAPEPRLVWGTGRYFTLDMRFEREPPAGQLLPGMSVRVRTQNGATQVAKPPMSALAASILPSARSSTTLQLEGEIIATRSATLAGPPLVQIWQLNIAEMVPEGSMVKAGDVVVRFEATELHRQLLDHRNRLNEKQREREKLLLSLAERERSERLRTAEARAELDKAMRKASQPEEVVRGIDYKKLTIDRARHERRMGLTERREKLAAGQRRAELDLVEVEIQRHELEVKRLTGNIESLAIKAPMDGMMLHRAGWNGVKFDVGSQVFIGLPVAEIPDMQSLAVRGLLPERELLRAAVGARARVHVEGGSGATLHAKVVRIGQVVRSKSRVQPIPIVELHLELERRTAGLRPGQPVRIELETATPRVQGNAE